MYYDNMRKALCATVFLSTLLGAFYAHAGAELINEPPFMDPTLPDKNECYTNGYIGTCKSGMSITAAGVTELNLRVSVNGAPTEILTVEAYPAVECLGGVCSGKEGLYYGEIQSQKRVHYVLVEGYYIHQRPSQDEPSIYRRGTGPLANDFPQYAVRSADNVPTPTAAYASHVVGGDFPECGPQFDTCMVDGEELPRGELPTYYEFADVGSEEGTNHFCQMESCFNNDGDFIGLNPYYHEYR